MTKINQKMSLVIHSSCFSKYKKNAQIVTPSSGTERNIFTFKKK